jgi:xanthine/CO dehydrogenase XdhC/CoxF family maturation factor
MYLAARSNAILLSVKEIREILDRVSAFAADERGVLATVFDVRGSGYRLPGARMLILANGDTFGTVSGGCLEADLLERARRLMASGRAEVFTYDTTDDEDSVFSMNMGCRGVIRILLEPIGKENSLLQAFKATLSNRERQAIATLVSAVTSGDVRVGSRMFYDPVHGHTSDNLPRFLTERSEPGKKIEHFFASGRECDLETFQIPEGSFEFNFENVESPISLLIFGAGADAVPMARIASEMGWPVTVQDHRPAYLTAERFPSAEKRVLLNSDASIGTPAPDTRTAAVVMNHNYGRDREILAQLLPSNVFYIGMLGPKRRTEQVLEELAARGTSFTDLQMDRVYAPVGLDIGADTPESIALSIAGEIESVSRKRRGGHLRDRDGPIYDRT